MKVAPIIILDEATAKVDPENEAELTKAIEELTWNKTIIMIAHRLKTVRHADQILVVADGKITQRGTHVELMEKKGIYRDFVSERKEAVSWKIARCFFMIWISKMCLVFWKGPGIFSVGKDCISSPGINCTAIIWTRIL